VSARRQIPQSIASQRSRKAFNSQKIKRENKKVDTEKIATSKETT
jgi:hypothetical protein